MNTARKTEIKYGMIGGGPGSFIGAVHRRALDMEGTSKLVAGCFSRDKEKNHKMIADLHLDKERVYLSFADMASEESSLEDGIDFVVIVTPNNSHFSIAKEFLNHGISVVCEKPLTVSVSEAEELRRIKEKNDCSFCVTYTYSGYAMAKEAKQIVQSGAIGDILLVNAEYAQGWLVDRLEDTGHKQAAWRLDPTQAGISSCVADLGSHVENLVSYITGLKATRLLAKLDKVGKGRKLDTNAEILLDFENEARGLFWCSQIAIGNENSLKVRIFGTKGSIEFEQETCNYLKVCNKDQPAKIYSRGNEYLSDQAKHNTFLPAGHPEGYLAGYVNIYLNFLNSIKTSNSDKESMEKAFDFPTIQDGIQSVQFITKCVESSNNGSVWVDMD